MKFDQKYLPDAIVGGAVALFGIVEVFSGYPNDRWMGLLLSLLMGVAAGLCRRAPGVGLALVWVTGILQISSSHELMLVQLAAAIVSFGCARWGNATVLWLSGLSILAGSMIAVTYQLTYGITTFGLQLPISYDLLSSQAFFLALLVAVGLGVLVVPWLLGLLLRSRERTRESQVHQSVAEAEAARAQTSELQAREIADLRAQQARLANDVHDVVGHSLAVILAQAESAQFFTEGDTERLQETMTNIATSARQSLQDVRQVLATSDKRATGTSNGGLDSLIEGLRTAGNDVISTVVGNPQPLPPELEAVAFRVLQEMLTNALKHGRRGEPVTVERHWEGDLRIEVRNQTSEHGAEQNGGPGQGLDGMRGRLEAVGGRLDVRRREEPGSDSTRATFTATAWVPLRAAR